MTVVYPGALLPADEVVTSRWLACGVSSSPLMLIDERVVSPSQYLPEVVRVGETFGRKINTASRGVARNVGMHERFGASPRRWYGHC